MVVKMPNLLFLAAFGALCALQDGAEGSVAYEDSSLASSLTDLSNVGRGLRVKTQTFGSDAVSPKSKEAHTEGGGLWCLCCGPERYVPHAAVFHAAQIPRRHCCIRSKTWRRT